MLFTKKQECTRDTARADFLSYRPFYGVLPPEHERSIHLGELGRFTREGEFLRLGSVFEDSDRVEMKSARYVEGLVGIPRPGRESVSMSEEMVFDPFLSRTTGWTRVGEDELEA